jgi:hypothetical protein
MSFNLLDLAKLNGSDPTIGMIDEAYRVVPEFSGIIKIGPREIIVPNVGHVETITGREYKTLIRTANPRGGFRNANDGPIVAKSTYENRLVETFILNPRWSCDKAIADNDQKGPARVIALEGSGLITGALQDAAANFYYGQGTGGNAKGHPGLIDSVDAEMIVDATGSTASTGSSVWAVKWGQKGVCWVMGNNGSLDMSDVRIGDIIGENSQLLTAYIQEMFIYPGVQVGHKFAIGRIKNLTGQAGKTLTDALIGSLVTKFPVGMEPDCLFMSRRSREQLRNSRTTYSPTGSEASIPTEWNGIPIIATDAILDTETIA